MSGSLVFVHQARFRRTAVRLVVPGWSGGLSAGGAAGLPGCRAWRDLGAGAWDSVGVAMAW
jgi:hypothetical protein